MSLSKKAAKAKKLEVKKSVLEWCKNEVAKGKELSLHWDGGGDSGWCHFQINGKEEYNEYTEYLIDMMYAELNYGSWAGEFQASGKAVFDINESAFVGVDYYSEEETVSEDCNIDIRIPKNLWFDSFSVQLEADSDEEPRVDISFNIKNGFLSEQHNKLIDRLESHIKEEVSNVVDEFVNNPVNQDYRGMWDNIVIEKNEFKEEGDFYIHKITELDIRSASVTENNIFLTIEEDEMLPEKED